MKPSKYILIASILLIFPGCKKEFLKVEDNSFINRQSYVKDLKTMEEFLIGNYEVLHRYFYYGLNTIYPELTADNIKPIVGTTFFINHYNWAQQADTRIEDQPAASSLAMNASWKMGYQMIRSCSFVIEETDKYRNQNPTKADDLKAQAYSLRAMIHFQLVNIFSQSYLFSPEGSHSGIPYITTSDINESVRRETVANAYAHIISDIDNAIPLFKAGQTNVLFMNINAAKALLARVYLFKSDYESAKRLAREVGTNVPIMTGINYPSKLFTPQETEALFQLPPAGGGVNGSTYSTIFAGVFLAGSQQRFLATNDIATILKESNQDSRNSWTTPNGTNWNVTKYPSNVIGGFSLPAGSYYQTLFRSSEMYLTASECYAKLNNEDSARFYLNAIRLRANPTAGQVIATGTALLDSIYKERRKELCFEGLRMFDLGRWKMGVNRTDALSPSVQTLPYPSNKAIAPIPVPDVTLSGLQQNMGY